MSSESKTPAAWMAEHPGFPWLAAGMEGRGKVEMLLQHMQVLGVGERVAAVEKAGEGNMNLTLRVRIERGPRVDRTLIVKQSRPWVEKYDVIAAPWDRVNVEAAFYRKVRGVAGVSGRMPGFVGSDAAARVMVLEDLGPASDLSGVYRSGEVMEAGVVAGLAGWLRGLHDAFRGGGADGELSNMEMRRLNHAHMYELPLGTEAGRVLAGDGVYARKVREAGAVYLGSRGPCLLHGDFFPGSWVRVGGGDVKVIDPEFCFFGPAEFDVGVALGHLAMARQPRSAAEGFLGAYGGGLEMGAVGVGAGVEVMRRLIGVAKLPLAGDLDQAELLERSRQAVVRGDVWALWG